MILEKKKIFFDQRGHLKYCGMQLFLMKFKSINDV